MKVKMNVFEENKGYFIMLYKKKELLELINFIKENIENYSIIRNEKITEENVLEYFKKLPIVKKEDIRKNYKKFIDKEIADEIYESEKFLDIFDVCNKSFEKDYVYQLKNKTLIVEYTSGTTGSPFVIFKTPNERLQLGISMWNMREKVGNIKPQKMFQFIHNFDGVSSFPFKDKYSQFRIKKEMEYLMKSDYEWWHIYPSMLEEYASCVKDNKICFKKLKGIECNGAYISEKEMDTYADIFNCKIVNNYGTRELWNIAYGTQNERMEINPDVIIELIDEEGNIINKANVVGRIVATSLKLRTMPFVRYYIGDLAYFVENTEKRMIRILPGRSRIFGTKIYGNQFFRDVIIDLMQVYNLKKIESVNIKEVKNGEFIVNFVNNREERKILEKKFIECINFYGIEDSKKWKFHFQYDNSIRAKSLFTSVINKNDY